MELLEVLIPTHRRSESAAEAIESVVSSPDQRIAVRCNSNGYEPILERYRNHEDKRINYDCFFENRGSHANFLHLLKTSKSKFCMFLSDEDCLNKDGIAKFLDFLKVLNGNVHLISCATSVRLIIE